MRKRIIIELLPLMVLVLAHVYTLQNQHFMFAIGDFYRWFALLISITPLLFFYAALRMALTPLLSALLVSGVSVILDQANRLKLQSTDQPLTWTDISTDANISIIKPYLTTTNTLWLAAGLMGIALIFYIEKRYLKPPRAYKFILALSFITGVISFYSYLDSVSKTSHQWIVERFRRNDVVYVVWNWPENVMRNGLLMHLVQTSRRPLPDVASPTEKEHFTHLVAGASNKDLIKFTKPSNVIMILCESCWHNDQFFKEAFKPLRDLKYREFRTISPVFGGLTVNSSFELLSGLPANNGVLKGVIYQDYHQVMKDEVLALPRQMQLAGYHTTAAHNFERNFWHRQVINPKFGFQNFYALDDMKMIPYSGMWPDDQILFDFVVERFKESPSNNFMYLTTVSTHGPYNDEHDGEINYATRMSTASERIASFTKEILAIAPDTLFLIVGDHKPALSAFYEKNGIAYSTDSMVKRGDVPGYIFYRNKRMVDLFIKRTNHLPLFCVSYYLDHQFTHTQLPTFNYVSQEKICQLKQADDAGYEYIKAQYPSWLYSLTMFE